MFILFLCILYCMCISNNIIWYSGAVSISSLLSQTFISFQFQLAISTYFRTFIYSPIHQSNQQNKMLLKSYCSTTTLIFRCCHHHCCPHRGLLWYLKTMKKNLNFLAFVVEAVEEERQCLSIVVEQQCRSLLG